jgi:hypothetical protein
MEIAMSEPMPIHYHIRWTGKPLDWEPFATEQAATAAASQLVRRNETYSIEKFDSSCIRCKRPSENSLSDALAGAIKRGKAQFGLLQLLDRKTGALRMVAQHGFSRGFLEHFKSVPPDATAWGNAAMARQRVVVNDISNDPVFNEKTTRELVRSEDVRSVQAMPLITSAGQLVGVLAIHYCASHAPSAHQPDLTYVQDIADHLDQFTRCSRK